MIGVIVMREIVHQVAGVLVYGLAVVGVLYIVLAPRPLYPDAVMAAVLAVLSAACWVWSDLGLDADWGDGDGR